MWDDEENGDIQKHQSHEGITLINFLSDQLDGDVKLSSRENH